MSLGIVLRGHSGIALGADSLVTSERIMLDPEKAIKTLQEADMASITKEDLIKQLMGDIQSMAANNFRSSKVRPIYYINGRPYGARIKTGNDFLATLQDSVIAEIESPAVQQLIAENRNNKPLSFKEYINLLNTNFVKELAKMKFRPMSANFLYAGYCVVSRKYEVCDATFFVEDANEEGNCVVENNFKDKADSIISMVGDAEIADTLLTGTSNKTDRLVKLHLCQFAEMVVRHVLGLADAKSFLVQTAKATIIKKLPPIKTKCEEILSSKLFASAYDSVNDTLPLPYYIQLMEMLSTWALMRTIEKGKEIGHMQFMSCRELLKIIQFLIEATARVHEYLKDSIPTVGGDIYFATITNTEGFVFRNLEDNF
ncbi:MAG: hypothetical protein HZC05_00515 [Candidatus Magasanikbacteria bacterium]|nr:hypothetical protein [Candidatus Magasanikbacteria bacterium]